MKIKILSTLALLGSLILIGGAGCATSNALVPKSVIHVTDATGKKLDIELPKDMEAESIALERMTNGSISLEIKKIKVRTNPDVIGAAGAAQADAIAKLTDLCAKLLETAEKGAIKSVVPIPK